eukprot:3789652-Rhodomonas_salina.1
MEMLLTVNNPSKYPMEKLSLQQKLVYLFLTEPNDSVTEEEQKYILEHSSKLINLLVEFSKSNWSVAVLQCWRLRTCWLSWGR